MRPETLPHAPPVPVSDDFRRRMALKANLERSLSEGRSPKPALSWRLAALMTTY